ncbi:hypothetical protein [Streptomyces sp. NPDC006875]|uniref:hypothetical protein n=1 Tax=Streptomyces sp. NPDC006875 TaxID=3154781 RepID=UPI0033F6D33A
MHEAGHLVTVLLVGIHVIDVTLTPENAQHPCGPTSGVSGDTQIGRVAVPPPDYLTMPAAGELAHQRWLREAGLYTPARAWAVERGALDDTTKAIGVLRTYYPGVEDNGYRQVFWQYRPGAQDLLDADWQRVLEMAAPLAAHGHLSGDEASFSLAEPGFTHRGVAGTGGLYIHVQTIQPQIAATAHHRAPVLPFREVDQRRVNGRDVCADQRDVLEFDLGAGAAVDGDSTESGGPAVAAGVVGGHAHAVEALLLRDPLPHALP